MNKKLDKLLSDLCTEYGFCLSIDSIEKLKEIRDIDATEFAEAILLAEGMNPETEIERKRKIRNKFIEMFGQRMKSD